MPLERQVITMPLAQGVDTKTDAKQVVAGKLLELENGVFTTLKAIRKRDGNVALSRDVANASANIANGAALATYGNELLLSDTKSIYSYDDANNAWVTKGDFVSINVERFSVLRNSYSQSQQDGATHSSGLQLFAYEDTYSANKVFYTVIDGATGQTVQASTQLSASGIKPRVLALANVFVVYFFDISGGVLKVAVLPANQPNATPTITTLTGTGATANDINTSSPNYDACTIETAAGTQIALVFNNAQTSGATTLRMYSGTAPTTQTVTQAVIPYRSQAITVFPANTNDQGNPGPVVGFCTYTPSTPNSTYVRYAAYGYTLGTALSSGALFGNTTNPTACSMITGVQTAESGFGFSIFWANENTPFGMGSVFKEQFVAGYSVTQTTILSPAGIFARAFAYKSKAYLPVVYASQLQPTYFIVDDQGIPVAKALAQSAGPVPRYRQSSPYSLTAYVAPMLATTQQLDNNSFRIAALEQSSLNGTGLEAATAVSCLTFDFNEPQRSFLSSELAQNLHFSGGFVQMYDGVSVVEHNFHLYPETIVTNVAMASGSLSAGAYSYVACYEWLDNQNNLHQSHPSPASQVTVTLNQSVDVTIPYLRYTAKRNTRPVQLVLYRTEADGKILYRVSSVTAPTVNSLTGAETVTINDGLSDADLAVRPQLYSQFLAGPGYEVKNDPAPPTGLIQLHRNRIWVADSTNRLQLWYSKECTIGSPIAFSNLFVKQIDPRGGPITALATVDDKLLVFKKSHIFFIVGQGPTNTNENNDLSDAILITTDCGCIEPRSVVGTPVGIMFQSAKGIYLIDRSLAVQYVGAPVEAYNNEVITSATLVSTTNQVRFTLESGKTLVFDYFVQQWGTFTNQYAVDSLVWQDTMVMLRSNGSVLKETPGVFTDAGSPIKLKLATSWLSFANVQGFQRVRRAQILGAWKSAHNLLVSVCVDFNDTIIQQATIVPAPVTYYGGSSPYGAESVYGGTFQLYQWRVDLARQKTQAVKLILEDLPAATAGEGLSLTSLGFEVGAKTGLNKVPASQIVS